MTELVTAFIAIHVLCTFFADVYGLLDISDEDDITEWIYKVPCTNYGKMYVWKPGRKLGVGLQDKNTGQNMKQRQSKHSQKSAHCRLSRDQQIRCDWRRYPTESYDQHDQCHSDLQIAKLCFPVDQVVVVVVVAVVVVYLYSASRSASNALIVP